MRPPISWFQKLLSRNGESWQSEVAVAARACPGDNQSSEAAAIEETDLFEFGGRISLVSRMCFSTSSWRERDSSPATMRPLQANDDDIPAE